jgi:hypothetical protein
MVLWQWINDYLPPYAEQITINEEAEQIQETLSQFKQLVPNDFVELETKNRNYMCSTQGWKEPVCERYMFFRQNQQVQVDIPHEIMAKLELEVGKDIPYPVYLDPKLLDDKELSVGAFTLKNEKEIFIQKPLNGQNLTSELTKWSEEINVLRNQLNQKEQELKKWEKTFSGENASQVQVKINNLNSQVSSVNNQLTTVRKELEKEKGWWDKWVKANQCIIMEIYEKKIVFQYQPEVEDFKNFIKTNVYHYYRDK